MQNLLKRMAMTSLLILIFASNSWGESFDSPLGDWTTQWQRKNGSWSKPTPFKILDKNKATYSLRNGRILFYDSSDPYRWEGFWVQDSAISFKCETKKDGSKYWGVYTIQFNEDYSKFQATYDTCGDGNKAKEFGAR